MNEASISRRLFLESTVASGTLLSLGSSLALADDAMGRPAAGKIGDVFPCRSVV